MNFASAGVYRTQESDDPHMNRSLLALLLASMALRCLAQQNAPPGEKSAEDLQNSAPYGYMAPAQDAYQGAWNKTESLRTANLWRSLCEARPSDVGAQLNWFRSERNARLGQNNGRLQESDKAQLNAIADNINTTAPGSFEQHMTSYYVQFPQRSAYGELEKANAVDGGRSELILPMVNRANANGDKPSLDSWCIQLEARGELSPALNDVAQDLLLSVDKDGILFTNGDMDGAPALVQQRLRDTRRDVLLVDQRLLVDATYREQIWTNANAKGPVPSAGPPFASTLHSATERPIFFALSLDRTWFDAFPGGLCATGIAFKLKKDEVCETSVLEQRWGAMKKTTSAGPLSRNYLLPGAVLLEHYRSTGNETRASQLEHELRVFGTAVGATNDLIKAGVLTH